MPVIDYESAWFSLKAHIASKRSHSERELAEVMARLEVGHRLPEGSEGFDERPMPAHDLRSSHSPADDESERDLSEPAQIVSAAS